MTLFLAYLEEGVGRRYILGIYSTKERAAAALVSEHGADLRPENFRSTPNGGLRIRSSYDSLVVEPYTLDNSTI